MKSCLSSIPTLIYRLARRNPDKVAVIDTDLTSYTYGTLNSMADTIKKMFPTTCPARVGILMGAGIRQIASVLAIVKNGGAYVPLDPALNSASLSRQAREAKIDFVLTDTSNEMRLEGTPAVVVPQMVECSGIEESEPLDFKAKDVVCSLPDNKGKFQEFSRKDVRSQACFLSTEFGIKSDDVVLQSSMASSRMFVAEVFATMIKGATLAILPEKNRGYAKAVADFAEQTGVTIICGYRNMVDEIGLLKNLPSKLRLMLSAASDRLSARFSGLNRADLIKGWSAVNCSRLSLG